MHRSRLMNHEVRTLVILFLAALALAVSLALRGWLDSMESPAPGQVLAPAPIEQSSQAMVDRFQARLRGNPEDTYAYAQLGLALQQQVRETADASLYNRAQMALDAALSRDPNQLDALVGQGMLALSRHDFAGALTWADQARALNPFRATILGIKVDAQVELGRYDEAVATLQAMVTLRPDQASYSRVSYMRELYGDVAGAEEAMQAAVDAGLPTSEGTLWSQVQLGHLYFNSGDPDRAEQRYQAALRIRPDYIYAQAGLARVEAARGHDRAAIAIYESVIDRLPMPAFLIVLGELYEATGQPAEAQRQYDLVRVIQQLNAGAGMNVDLEMALFDADHGPDPAQALTLAREAYALRPSIYVADALAWALYRSGSYIEAAEYSQESLRIGTQDAMLYFHRGMIALALADPDGARTHLQTALSINPYFSVAYANQARERLAELTAAKPTPR